ncbi:MAG: hypothetical protein KIT54_08535 [Phycisphaeraceae bacterium]|nr:hypothetical protein [Phycisphaeraceae bacterium]
MPKTPVILALLVAIALVVASMWLLRPPSDSGAFGPQSVLEIDAAAIVVMETTLRGGPRKRIERTPIGWSFLAGDGPPWAVQEGRARAAARILADLQGRPVRNDEALPAVTATLVIEDSRGRKVSLGLREPIVGGRRVVDRVDSQGQLQRFAIDQPLYEAFAQTGFEAWRDPGLLGALPGRAARIEIDTGVARLELGRVEGTWAVRAPVATRAHEPSVDALLQAIARVRVERFDQPPPPLLTAARQTTITLEADTTTPGADPDRPDRVTERLVLTLHGPADTSGRLTLLGVGRFREPRHAGAAVQDLGTAYVAADLAPLQSMPLHASGFVARTTLEGDASLVGALGLDGLHCARVPGGWAIGPDTAPAEVAAALDALAALLTVTPMSGVVLTDRPEPLGRPLPPIVVHASTITGQSLTPPDGFTLMVVEAPGGAASALLIGQGVTREYLGAESLAAARAALEIVRRHAGDQ